MKREDVASAEGVIIQTKQPCVNYHGQNTVQSLLPVGLDDIAEGNSRVFPNAWDVVPEVRKPKAVEIIQHRRCLVLFMHNHKTGR